METRMIEVSVRGQEISCTVQHPYPRTNTVQYLHVHFDTDAIWDPLKKIAVFRRSGTATVAVPMDETMMCEMPPQMMAVPGYSGPVTVHIGLIGVGEDGSRLTTGEVPVTVNPSCYTAGKTPHPPAPDVYEELLRLIREAAENDVEEIRAALDAYFAENPIDVSGKLDKNQGAANAGKVLGIDEDGAVVPVDAPTGNEGGIVEETDPTVPAWAKQPEKPAYTADEVGAISQDQLGNAVNQALLEAKETGEFDGAPGKDGNPGVYVGSGDMPEGYNVQIDPNGDAFTVDDLITSPMVGATATAAGKAGLVPAPAAGDNGKFLRGDGTWGEIAVSEGGGSGGGGDEVWEEVVNATVEEEVKDLIYTFADSPLKKMVVMIDTSAASADASYSPVTVMTSPDVNPNFYTLRFYPRPIPGKVRATSVFAVELIKAGETVYSSIRSTYQPIRSNTPSGIENAGADSPVTSNIVRHLQDAYSRDLYTNITGFKINTYATFPVGTTIKIIGVRA